MKQADLRVGTDYAFLTYKPYDAPPSAARVRVVSMDGGGRVTVRVIQPGPKPPKDAWSARVVTVGKGEQRQVTTRDLVCPWEQWADRVAAIDAEQKARAEERQKRHDDFERREADRLVVDSTRALPAEYDEDYFYDDRDAQDRTELCDAYIKARSLGPYVTLEELKPLLVNLPVRVLRDILAAPAYMHTETPADTVAATFRRAAALLEEARVAGRRRGQAHGAISQPGIFLGETDIAFVNALCEGVAVAGGELLLPPVPTLPHWVAKEERAVAPIFGWLRLAVGDTDGRRLHSSACSLLRSRSLPTLQADHMPWWSVMLWDPRELCSKCGGPGARDLVPLAGFVAAADVWHERGRGRIEDWQKSAFQRLLTATASARAEPFEPDVTLLWRIVATMAGDAPDEDGWAAYTLVNGGRYRSGVEELTPGQRKAATGLARARLTALESALPESQRPLSLPKDADDSTLQQRYRHLKELLGGDVPQLDRLLFTLPGAVVY